MCEREKKRSDNGPAVAWSPRGVLAWICELTLQQYSHREYQQNTLHTRTFVSLYHCEDSVCSVDLNPNHHNQLPNPNFNLSKT